MALIHETAGKTRRLVNQGTPQGYLPCTTYTLQFDTFCVASFKEQPTSSDVFCLDSRWLHWSLPQDAFPRP